MTVSRRSSGLVLEDRSSLTAAPTELVDRSRFRNDGVFTDITMIQLPSGLWVYPFNGTTSFIDCGVVEKTGAYSLETWMNATSHDQYDRIIQRGNVDGEGFILWFPNATAELTFDDVDTDEVSTDSAISYSTWYHVVGGWDGTTQFLYLNGVAQSGVTAGGPGSATSDLSLGRREGAATNYYTGYLAIPHIYNYALNPAQVRVRFNETRGWFNI